MEKKVEARVGNWSAFTCEVSEQAKQAFKEIELIGTDYTIVAVSHQLVEGTNYRYFCNTKAVYPNAPYSAAIVCLYKPLKGKAILNSIIPLHI